MGEIPQTLSRFLTSYSSSSQAFISYSLSSCRTEIITSPLTLFMPYACLLRLVRAPSHPPSSALSCRVLDGFAGIAFAIRLALLETAKSLFMFLACCAQPASNQGLRFRGVKPF